MTAVDDKPKRLISGPGMLLVWFYGVMVVGAVSRSVYQITTEFDVRSPLATPKGKPAVTRGAFCVDMRHSLTGSKRRG